MYVYLFRWILRVQLGHVYQRLHTLKNRFNASGIAKNEC